MAIANREPDRAERLTLDLRKQSDYLRSEWRGMFRLSTIGPDIGAGVAVALVALPLSLAIANASGVKPEVGLVTAVVGGIVAALFGGCRLQVAGPAAAMTFLVYEVLTRYGMGGLIATTFLAGLLQLAAAWFRIGRFMQFIPRPVVAGFLSGIGLTILCTQLSVILGYEVTHEEEGGAVGLLWQTLRKIPETNPHSLIVGAVAIATMLLLPRFNRRLPTSLFAVVLASVLPILMGWESVKLLGALPRSFPIPMLPQVPWGLWNEIVLAAFTVFLLASIESLLSATVVDSMAKDTKVDNDQELFGQGLANLASALFGGIPVTGVIARSATNIQSGARTRLASIVHAVMLLMSMFLLGPLVARVPVAALAGVLAAVAFRMVELRLLRALWHGSKPEALVFAVTVGAILVTDLIDGVQIGMLATVLYFVYEMSRLHLRPVPLNGDVPAEPGTANDPRVLVLDIEGPLFFASSFHLRNMVVRLKGPRCIVLDMEGVSFLDVSGAEALNEQARALHGRGIALVVARPNPNVRWRLETLAEKEFHDLLACPIFDTLEEAVWCGTRMIEGDDASPAVVAHGELEA